MKWILSLLVCWAASAQLPVIPFNPSSSVPFDFNSVANLYIEMFSIDAADWTGNTNGGTTLGKWLDRTTFHNDFTNGQSTSHYVPLYQKGNGPTNGWCVDFKTNGVVSASAISMQCVNTTASNQPNAIFIVGTFHSNPSTYNDSVSGGREILNFATAGVANSSFYAGTSVPLPGGVAAGASGSWVVISEVFNGANSYIRTNGVLYGTGNPNTQGLGKMEIGDDPTYVAPFLGKMVAVLVYGQAPSTNDLQNVEKNLSKMFGHIYVDGL